MCENLVVSIVDKIKFWLKIVVNSNDFELNIRLKIVGVKRLKIARGKFFKSDVIFVVELSNVLYKKM